MDRHVTIGELLFLCKRRVNYTSVTTEVLLGNGVFLEVRGKML
jgi:hypothetical protein